ncbi:hypothetical protein [Legionella septentrionalis]|uniref:Uncharacterized protein n=1 Tax=Legionella septentrionalis TaxID=2498109 RepID=A0A3S0VM65_9GAMM|nr:hypothetical protein [Legionella septentrionalis]RUQ81519.1 hypothetical protein EKM59_10520 [Legionella septentrionalis]
MKKMFKDSALSKNKFDSALARELLSAQFKLNKLLDEADPVFKRTEHPGDEFCRKSFSHYLRAYEKYQDITAFEPYKTPDGRAAGLIVLLQRYSNTGSNNEQKYYYFDPISELEDFNEETLIHLHSYGPIEYNHIEKLEVGDVIKAYVYDPEDFGFLEPHESTIKVISIDKPDDWERNITIEITEKSSGDIMMDVQQKPVIRTLKRTTM